MRAFFVLLLCACAPVASVDMPHPSDMYGSPGSLCAYGRDAASICEPVSPRDMGEESTASCEPIADAAPMSGHCCQSYLMHVPDALWSCKRCDENGWDCQKGPQ